MSGKRQKRNQYQLTFTWEGRGEASMTHEGGTEPQTAIRETERPADDERLMEEVCQRDNLMKALKHVRQNSLNGWI